MTTSTRWICSFILAVISVLPALAGANETPEGKKSADGTATTAAQPATAAANPSTPAVGTNVTALLGVLVMKGVLAPEEAKSIEAAPPTAEFQALVDVLARKGVVNAADLAAVSPASSEGCPTDYSCDRGRGARHSPHRRLRRKRSNLLHLRWLRRSHRCECCRLILLSRTD